jgi:hypothetical protein
VSGLLQLKYERQRENVRGGGVLARVSRVIDSVGRTDPGSVTLTAKGNASAYVRPTPPRLQKLQRQCFGPGAEHFGLRNSDDAEEDDVGYRKNRAKGKKVVVAE